MFAFLTKVRALFLLDTLMHFRNSLHTFIQIVIFPWRKRFLHFLFKQMCSVNETLIYVFYFYVVAKVINKMQRHVNLICMQRLLFRCNYVLLFCCRCKKRKVIKDMVSMIRFILLGLIPRTRRKHDRYLLRHIIHVFVIKLIRPPW